MRPPAKIYHNGSGLKHLTKPHSFRPFCYVRQNSELKKLERWIKKTYYWKAPQTMNILGKIAKMKGGK